MSRLQAPTPLDRLKNRYNVGQAKPNSQASSSVPPQKSQISQQISSKLPMHYQAPSSKLSNFQNPRTSQPPYNSKSTTSLKHQIQKATGSNQIPKPEKSLNGAKKQNFTATIGFDFDNSLAEDIAKEKAAEQAKADAEKQKQKDLLDKQNAKREEGIDDLMSRITSKLDSANAKFQPRFGAGLNKAKKMNENADEQISQFKASVGKTPSTANRSSLNPSMIEKTPDQNNNTVLGTPAQFNNSFVIEQNDSIQKTDEQGNRMSILPGSGRPSTTGSKSLEPNAERPKLTSTQTQKKALATSINTRKEPESKKSQLEVLKQQIATAKPQSNTNNNERKNFVRINQNQAYKPRMRGAAYSNKIMAKKSNSLKFKARAAQRIKVEQLKAKDQVNAFGGLGKVGLDYEHKGEVGGEYVVPAFSTALQHLATPALDKELNSDDEMLFDNDDLADEIAQLEEIPSEGSSPEKKSQIKPEEDKEEYQDIDKPLYEIPETDEGFRAILKERFGHDDFKEGQLEAIKVMLHEKRNTLVVLATGGGKSLVYQFTTLFMPGLVLVVTPLIALMADQLGKLPEFLPGAAINSQQPYDIKKKVMAAVQEGKIKTLFITPERLFLEDLAKFGRKISMVCIDEIHCASEWSHNFRPTYLMLHEMIKEKIGVNARVLGLTATATKTCQKQVCKLFDVEYPRHLITQPDLSRLNLELSITRDADKTKALMTLIRSESFQGLTSILLFATQRKTTEQVASYLSGQGISASAYHAGKSDEQRAYIQKQFCANKIRILCCTIAFSMGIDKSDIQSVIHYDMPRAIENYVQEIGRAGRDGNLARCHMFLNDQDFYQLRRISLQDLLDTQSGLRLTNRIISQAKREFVKTVMPEKASLITKAPKLKTGTDRKRKISQMENGEDDEPEFEQLIDVFQQEELLEEFYGTNIENETKNIVLSEVSALQDQPLYIALDTKELTGQLDLKKEVVMTMLNQLEHIDNAFFRVDSVLPASLGVRFHARTLEELVEEHPLFAAMYSLKPKSCQGVFRVSTVQLAIAMRVKPYNVPRILYQLQTFKDFGFAYETDHESFILEMKSIPGSEQATPLAQSMLEATHKIEQALIQKLNCMYFIGQKVSLPSMEALQKRERTLASQSKEDLRQMYKNFSKQLNELINTYFGTDDELGIEVAVAGSEEERNARMPLQYIENHRTKTEITCDINYILKEFHSGHQEQKHLLNPANRMKPLDVVKILLGVLSKRECVLRYQNDQKVWANRQDFDVAQLLELSQAVVAAFYDELLSTISLSKNKRAH